MNASRWLVLVPVLLLAACDGGRKGGAEGPVREARGECMGTVWTAKWFGGPEPVAGANGVIGVLDEFEDVFSTWRPESEISRFNRNRSVEPIEVTEPLYRIVGQACQIAEQTDGAFDPTVGPFYALYQRVKSGEEVSEGEWSAARGRVGYQKLKFLSDTDSDRLLLQKQNPELELDVSAIAKGAGSDVAADHLRSLGATAAMVEIGGEVRAFGTKPGGTKWRLAVENPAQAGGGRGADPVDLVWLGGTQVAGQPATPQGLATSGSYRNFAVGSDGERLHHIFDPRTGRNAEHRTVSVSVLAADCATADAWATALMVLGPDAGRELHTAASGWNALIVGAPAEPGGDWQISRLGWE